MRELLWTAVAVTVACTAAVVDAGAACPDGFFYGGQDTAASNMYKSYWLEEVGRSPIYSCYRLEREVPGISAALAACNRYEAYPVVLEDRKEVLRVIVGLNLGENESNTTFGTGAMHFGDIDSWVWLGTTNASALPLPVDSNDTNVEQCLRVKGVKEGEAWKYRFAAFRCNDPMDYVCETRVQTVTYVAWFYSNWLTVLLIAMLVTLTMVLCVAAVKHGSKKPRMYRGRSTTPQGCGPSTLPFNEAPPSYKDVAKEAPTAESTFEKYRTKGKEMLAKVTFYNPSTSNNPTTN